MARRGCCTLCDRAVGKSVDSRAINLPPKSLSHLRPPPPRRPSSAVALPTPPLHTLGPPRHKTHTIQPRFPGASGGASRRTVGARKTAQRLDPNGSHKRTALPGTRREGQCTKTRGLRPVPWKRRPLAQGAKRILQNKNRQRNTRAAQLLPFSSAYLSPPFGNKASYREHLGPRSPRNHQVPHTIRPAGPSLLPSPLVAPILPCESLRGLSKRLQCRSSLTSGTHTQSNQAQHFYAVQTRAILFPPPATTHHRAP